MLYDTKYQKTVPIIGYNGKKVMISQKIICRGI